MMLDFTHETYSRLLSRLKESGYFFYTFNQVAGSQSLSSPHVVIRHDVDRFVSKAFSMAKLEKKLGISSTYFFRHKTVFFKKHIISEIADLGHEIGYHYEELSDTDGDKDKAWELFKENLKKLDAFGGVKSITAHGKPFSKWNNRELWEFYSYKKLGVTVEAYIDVPWDNYLYFTDTGRNWSGKNNRRDKVDCLGNDVSVNNTFDLIQYVSDHKQNMIISFHPERWDANYILWLQSFVFDQIVNIAKKILIRK